MPTGLRLKLFDIGLDLFEDLECLVEWADFNFYRGGATFMS
eukprot:CAMPEP_0170502012 /NCGR_PEP_ID=MMETSP0208-20121228/40197_1 /TAXON_ID=197538 /ORGANISM="Strombidium inclinatum, Strain S3" /LENGTH=40 /DNA_ID= /DNA_START= /DNA_END= /DNA_ORIENTATION=